MITTYQKNEIRNSLKRIDNLFDEIVNINKSFIQISENDTKILNKMLKENDKYEKI